MVKNNGKQSNEVVFWEKFSEIFGKEKALEDKSLFDNFYAEHFEEAEAFCGYHEKAAETVKKARQLVYYMERNR